MQVNFKWKVADVVKVPLYADLTEATIIERRYMENDKGGVIVYETDLFDDGVPFTQAELEKYN